MGGRTVTVIEQRESQVIELLTQLEDWMFQYDFLLMQAAEMEPYPREKQTEEHLIRGCQSKVWIEVEVRDGRVFARGESYSMLVKGFLSILLSLIHDCPWEEVEQHSFRFVQETSIAQQLSQDRLSGLDAMVVYIKQEIRRKQHEHSQGN